MTGMLSRENRGGFHNAQFLKSCEDGKKEVAEKVGLNGSSFCIALCIVLGTWSEGELLNWAYAKEAS